MTLLEARGLAVTPPGAAAPAVEDVSFSLAPGEWVALTGPNGGGKSSLMLGLAGLWPTRGELKLAGADFGPHAGRELRRRVAVVLQDPSSQILQPTVRDELAFGPRNSGLGEAESAARVERWSRSLGLETDLDRDPSTLSAGRQQLVALAAALACEPDLLLADEPTAHLDPLARRRVLEAVRARVAEGLAVVWVTQIGAEVRAAHRSLMVGDGAPAGADPPAPIAAARDLLRIRVAPADSDDGPRVAVERGLDLGILERGVTAVVGRNGAGKSVLLWAAAGLAAPRQVRLEWLADREPPPIAALQFPELQIFEESPVDEVCYAAVSRGLSRAASIERARQYMDEMGVPLGGLANRRTWALAAGEKRVLEVVAALISPACLYVLDEPTAGLDASRRAALARLLRRVSEQSPVLIASQDHDWVRGLAGRIELLDPATTLPDPSED